MAATPPMTTVVPTPPSPLHGGRYDTYHATRKSTRQTTTRTTRVIQTPPLLASDQSQKSASSRKKKSSTSQSGEHLNSPPSSTHSSPHKTPKKNTRTQFTSAMNGNDSSRPTSEDPFYNPTNNTTLQQPSLNLGVNMLPTPVKTPRKKPIGQAALHAGGRVLFPDRSEDPMPTPRKSRKGKRHVGFSMYNSMEDGDAGVENEIPIFTDSKDKVPELDPSEDNPFLEKPSATGPLVDPSKGRGSKKRKATHGIDGNKDIEDAFKREEGMVYVFRGKKVFRKFPSEEPDTNEGEDTTAEGADGSNPLPQPRTRTSIKPRLLFPPAAHRATRRSKSDLEDEEAPTDIDDPDATETEHEPPPPPLPEKRTPIKTTFHGLPPDTPPDTGHATRSATKKAAAKDKLPSSSSLTSSPAISPVKLDFNKPLNKGAKKASPFDGWARTKPGAGSGTAVEAGARAGKGTKRGVEAMEEDGGGGAGDDDLLQGETSSKRAKADPATSAAT